jgi:hypothetical protein
VEQSEIEQQVGEAETSVERLRALYDQYFMGIERIEPQVARKDVERRIQMLRKTQIRNTALRFRFQNVLLRYNTFAAHWMRICRQIEEGTYKHHLRKAKERFDPEVLAREARDARKKAAALEYGDTEPPPPNGPSFELDDMEVDVDFDEGLDRADSRAALRSYAIPQDVMAPSVAGRAVAAMTKGTAAPAPAPTRGAKAEIERSTEPAPPPVASVAPGKAPPASPARPAAPPATATRPGAPPPPVAAGGRSLPPPLPPGAARPAAPGPSPARPGPPPPAASAAGPTRPAPPPPTATRPAPPPATATRPAQVGAAPAVAASGARAVPAAAGSRPGSSDPSHISDERVRQIYTKYVETRKSVKDPSAAISMDSLARSLRDSSAKLREKHAGKAVDFDVQVKDGKAVLKPIVR